MKNQQDLERRLAMHCSILVKEYLLNGRAPLVTVEQIEDIIQELKKKDDPEEEYTDSGLW